MNKRNRTIRKINQALGIKLYEWQEKYIFGESEYIPSGRRVGRTTATIIKLCLSSGDMASRGRASCYMSELFRTYTKLCKARGLKLREIVFLDYFGRDALRCQPYQIRTTYNSTRARPKIYNLRLRLCLWLLPKKDCRSCCLTCKYFSLCRNEIVGSRER